MDAISQKFLETLAVTFSEELSYKGDVNDDFAREAAFENQAGEAVKNAILKLKSLNVPIFRPDDYFAEMAKSDQHMHKVRQKILEKQKDLEDKETNRRLREEKKFAVKVQRSVEEKKQKEKRQLLEAVKKHRKGMKAQLETMLNNAKTLGLDEENGTMFKNKLSRNARNKKFGFGGKKKGMKRNDKISFNDPFNSKAKKNIGKKLNVKNRKRR